MSEVLSMLFECLGLWVIPVFRQGELALLSIQKSVESVFERILGVGDSSANTASIANSCVNGPYNYATCDERILQLCGGKPQLRHAPAAKK